MFGQVVISRTNASARPLAALIRMAPEGLGFVGIQGGLWVSLGSRGLRDTRPRGEREARGSCGSRDLHGARGACGPKSGS